MRPKDVFYRLSNSFSESDFEKLKRENPSFWKKLKSQFDIGRQIIDIQIHNGLERPNEKTLRYYLSEYAYRFLNYGPKSFPTSFNVLEPFFEFNTQNSIIQLVSEEESYGISLVDFLDFVTEPNFDLKNVDLYENIAEKVIYHFSFTNSLDEINFSDSEKNKFHIGSLSMVRQGNEVSMLMQTGKTFDKEETEQYFKKNTRSVVEGNISSYKRSLGLEIGNIEENPQVVNFQERDDLWFHSIALLFDLEKRVIDIRYVARDENISFTVTTDDFHAVFNNEVFADEKKRLVYFKRQLEELKKYDAIFDLAKFCLALPYYVYENENRIVDVMYETNLSEVLRGPLIKRKFSSVPGVYKTYAKSFFYLESSSQAIIKHNELNDDSFNVEKSGFWKRIGIDEEGFDKNGAKIIGKTWVERSDIYYSLPKGVTKIQEVEVFDGEKAGYIYIMRQPAHEENIFKIGLTKRDSKIRSKELSNTSSIDKFFIINNFATKDCSSAEKQIHAELENYRISSRREFFKCDLKLIMQTCEKIIAEINK